MDSILWILGLPGFFDYNSNTVYVIGVVYFSFIGGKEKTWTNFLRSCIDTPK